MRRRPWSRAVGLGTVGLALLLGCPSRDAPPGEPSVSLRYERIVLVSIDTLRADHLGAYGYPRPTSPFFDALADDGVLFERAYAATSTTSPSHASMFTGLHPLQHGVRQNGLVLRDDFRTLAEIMGAGGFRTAAFIASGAHFGPSNLDQGFAVFDEPERRHQLAYRGAHVVVDATLSWLEDVDRDERFLLFVHFYDVHQPLRPPPDHRDALAAKSEEQRRALLDLLVKVHGVPRPADRRAADGLVRRVSAYDGEIRFVDTELQRLYESFARLGLDDRTLWIVTSDHGEGLGNHGWEGHSKHVYQEQIRVPLVFHASDGSLSPRRVDAVVSHVDLLPTVVELLGPDRQTPGRTLWPLLDGLAPGRDGALAFAERRSFKASMARRHGYELGDKFALVGRRWKYIHRTIGGDELYDLETDPRELHNLASEREERAADLRQRAVARARELRSLAGAEAETVDEETTRALEDLGYIQR